MFLLTGKLPFFPYYHQILTDIHIRGQIRTQIDFLDWIEHKTPVWYSLVQHKTLISFERLIFYFQFQNFQLHQISNAKVYIKIPLFAVLDQQFST